MENNVPFEKEISAFLKHKRFLGYKYAKEESYLRAFSLLCSQNGWVGPELTKEIVDGWCSKRPFETPRTHSQRVAVIRQFAVYIQSMGGRAYFPMNVANNLSRHSKFVAYVYTHDEISRLIKASDEIFPHRNSTMHLVMPTLLRLLYSSGTRINETLSLQMRDVDLDNGVLRLVNTKNDKTRLVPMSQTMAEALRAYCAILHPDPQPDDYLFRNAYGERFNHQTVYRRFRSLLIEAGIPHGGRGAGPRIHDLRHTYACHVLQEAHVHGVDLAAILPVLAEYLGHSSVNATGRYLQMTAEVHPEIEALVEKACQGVIPEVIGDEQASY